MKNHQTFLRTLAPLGALLAVATLTGQSKPTCHSSPAEPSDACVTPQDCEGLPHVLCVGEWQCVQGECRYQCGPSPTGCHSDADCPEGEHCSVSDGDCQPDPNCPMCDVCYGECVPDKPKCVRSGCSGEVCAAEPVFTPCLWQDWFACLKLTRCGHFGPDGACGFEPNQAFLDCLAQLKPCKADTDCPAGLACVNGRCEKPTPVECQSDEDCPEGFYCEVEAVCPPCVDSDPPCLAPCSLKGECKPKPQPKGCWTDQDCAWYEYCLFPPYAGADDGSVPGARACCPPNAYCIPEIPPCGHGVCVLRPDYCWSDADCQKGEHCEGVIPPCPPGAVCFAAEQPGRCVADQPACRPIQPGSHGMCEMVLGWIFDGTQCVLESGCSCEPDCEVFFKSLDACQAACLGPLTCHDDDDCPPGQVCLWDGGCPPCDCDPAAGTDCACPMCAPPEHGFCMPAGCASDQDCAWYEYCLLPDDGGTDDGSVPGGMACCPPNAFCAPEIPPCGEGVCVLRPGYCWSDADCQKGQHCEGVIPPCPPGAVCFAAEQPGKCVPDAGKPCLSNQDCGPGEVCDTSACLSCCTDPTMNCIAACCGRCVPASAECRSDADCPTGQYCDLRMDAAGNLSGKCAPVPDGACVRDADCGEGRTCQFGPCPACFPCPCFGQCVYNEPQKCASNKDCPKGQVCKVEAVCPPCVYEPPYCDMPCWEEGHCVEGCYADADCPDGFVCEVAKCGGAKCPGPYQCVPGQPKCFRSGCSGEICSTESVITPCWYLSWFECLAYTQCGNFGPNGSCAFEQTAEFVKCLSKYGL